MASRKAVKQERCRTCGKPLAGLAGAAPAPGGSSAPGGAKAPGKSGFYPFCSERCRLADLANWFGERYRIPAAEAQEDKHEDEA